MPALSKLYAKGTTHYVLSVYLYRPLTLLSLSIYIDPSRACFTAVEWNPINSLVKVPALWTGVQKTLDYPAVVGVDLGTDEAFTVLSLFQSDPGAL